MRRVLSLAVIVVLFAGVGCRPQGTDTADQPSVRLVSANEEIQRLNMNVSWDSNSQRVLLKNNRDEIVMAPYHKTAIVNGLPVTLSLAPQINGRDVYLPSDFISNVLARLSPGAGETSWGESAPKPKALNTVTKIVIDAGHGGKDSGARGKSNYEKTVNLGVARKLQKALQEQGFVVKMTRTGDTYPELASRSTISNNFEPDLYISIHANAVSRGRSSTKGFEVLYPDERKSLSKKVSTAAAQHPVSSSRYAESGSPRLTSDKEKFVWNMIMEDNRRESKRLAGEIQKSMVKAKIGDNRGLVPRGDLFILNCTNAPTVLVEIGFISHPTEERVIASDAGQEKIARAIAEGVLNYKKNFDKNRAK